MLARTSQLRCSMHGLSRQRASSGSLARRIHPWRSGEAVPDRKNRTDCGKLSVRPGWTFASAGGPPICFECQKFECNKHGPNKNGAVASAVPGAPHVEPPHFDWRWRERPARALLAWETSSRSEHKLRRIWMESIRGIVRLPRQSSRGADLRNVYTERRSSPPARMLVVPRARERLLTPSFRP